MRETIPYAPGPTPQGGDLDQTQRFIETELRSISEALRLSVVQAAYGGMQIFGTLVLPDAGPTPQQVIPWDGTQPAELSRVEASTAAGTLTVQESGVYNVFCTLSMEVSSQRHYQFTVLRNGAPTNIVVVIDASGSSQAANVSFGGLVQLRAGDILALYYTSTVAGSALTINASTFILFRVSELQKVM